MNVEGTFVVIGYISSRVNFYGVASSLALVLAFGSHDR